MLRPTNLLIWLCLSCFILLRATWKEIEVLVKQALICGYTVENSCSRMDIFTYKNRIFVLCLSATVDRVYYQQWTFPPFRFLYFNITQSLAIIYGQNDWHYYFSQGLPLQLFFFLPFAVKDIYGALTMVHSRTSNDPTIALLNSTRYQLAVVCLFLPITLSYVSHKEVRFIYPILPAIHVLAASSFTRFYLPLASGFGSVKKNKIYLKSLSLILFFAGHVCIALFATQYHQPAPLSVLTYLRNEYASNPKNLVQRPMYLHMPGVNRWMTVGFLMPCHSTPWRSHLVFPGIKAWALGCEPPVHLDASARAAYVDEADQFYANPNEFLISTLGQPPPRNSSSDFRPLLQGRDHSGSSQGWAWDGQLGTKLWPEYLVFFEALEPILIPILLDTNYSECWSGWNSYFHDDSRRKGNIVVWCSD